MKKVKDIIMYQATTRNYKVGDILEFGKQRNYQAERVFATDYKMIGAQNDMPEMFVEQKLKKKKKLKHDEAKVICDILWNYGFSMRELGMEICMQKFYPKEPSRFTAMFLCKTMQEAKNYLSTAKSKGNDSQPKVVKVKLNGKLLQTSNSFNMRGGKSLDEFIEQAHSYWKGVDDNFENKDSIEYLFEGSAEVIEIFEF